MKDLTNVEYIIGEIKNALASWSTWV